MEIYKSLLEGNRRWVQEKLEDDPDYFSNLSKTQTPEVLWIGCADSRVPANQITGTFPGDIFVHRNIANMVVHTDMNMLSVLDYAVNVLNVKHVIICGHYGCGGVFAAMQNQQFGIMDNWIRVIKDVYRLHADELDAIQDKEKRFDRFVELNVVEQVLDLSKTSIIQNSWSKRKYPMIHGWVCSLKTGLIKDLNISLGSSDSLPDIYKITGPQPEKEAVVSRNDRDPVDRV